MIYLDYNATTPCDQRVVAAMLPFFTEKFGNASTKIHRYGWIADQAVEQARKEVADLIHADPSEIIFTSGATESCNLAIKGVFEKYKTKGNHIITCQTEHYAVLDTCRNLENKGAVVTYLSVDENGLIDLKELENAIQESTILIAVMYGNNETGVIQPIAGIAEIAKARKVLFFTDATQAVGKTEVDVIKGGIDLMALSAHKIYGPKGVGALYVRRKNPRVPLTEQMNGGGQERGMRSGTLNVPGIVGLGKACSILQESGKEEQERLKDFQTEIEQFFIAENNALINGGKANRLPNVSNISFEEVASQRLIAALNHEFAFSLGSACTSAAQGPSHVLTAMGLMPKIIQGSLRISMGRFTTEKEIQEVKRKFSKAVRELK